MRTCVPGIPAWQCVCKCDNYDTPFDIVPPNNADDFYRVSIHFFADEVPEWKILTDFHAWFNGICEEDNYIAVNVTFCQCVNGIKYYQVDLVRENSKCVRFEDVLNEINFWLSIWRSKCPD